jgi:hypothetical protein
MSQSWDSRSEAGCSNDHRYLMLVTITGIICICPGGCSDCMYFTACRWRARKATRFGVPGVNLFQYALRPSAKASENSTHNADRRDIIVQPALLPG